MSATDRLRCDVPADWFSDFSQCLFEWQGLEGGILAVVAASASLYFLVRQIRQAQDHRNDDIDRRHAAARVVLPIALSALIELADLVAERVAVRIEELDEPDFDVAVDHFDAGRHEQVEFPRISLPEEIISAVRLFVETLSDPVNVRHVAELMSSLQILVARYNGFNFRHAAPVEGLYGLLLDAAKVKALVDTMFNYGRFVDEGRFGVVGQTNDADAWDVILKAARGQVFFRPRLDRYSTKLSERIEGYKAASISPWNEKFEY